MLIAGLTAFLVFDKHVAAAAMLFLSLGDPAAALVGTRLPGPRFFGKSPGGTLAFVVVALAVCAGLVWTGVSPFSWGLVAGSGGGRGCRASTGALGRQPHGPSGQRGRNAPARSLSPDLYVRPIEFDDLGLSALMGQVGLTLHRRTMGGDHLFGLGPAIGQKVDYDHSHDLGGVYDGLLVVLDDVFFAVSRTDCAAEHTGWQAGMMWLRSPMSVEPPRLRRGGIVSTAVSPSRSRAF